MKMEKIIIMRTPDMMRTAHGHVVNKWCGSCRHKEIQAVSSGGSESKRLCTRLGVYVELDDICNEYDIDEKLAAL